jgi:hypothetical protein
VIPDGLEKERKFFIGQVDASAPQGLSEPGRSLSVAEVGTVVLPTAIVQEGKQLDDLFVRPGMLG